MHEGALRSLEFDKIVDVVCGLALTPLGATRLESLYPLDNIRNVEAALAETTECIEYQKVNGAISIESSPDLDTILTRLAIEALPLEANQLRSLANFLSSMTIVSRNIKQAKDGPFPKLLTTVENCHSFEEEISAVRNKINNKNEIVDEGSTTLRNIRERLSKQESRLRATLNSYLRGKATAKYLQDKIVTERGGRYVLIIKNEHRNSIPGIIHGSSGSGSSFFLEPLSTVDINNEIVALQENEKTEIQRILLSLSDLFRRRPLDVRNIVNAAIAIDIIQARASFSNLVDGVAPAITKEPLIDFKQARHPLLLPQVQRILDALPESQKTNIAPVPVDIRVGPPHSALIITGPNTGGKTVALKTSGLLTLMALCGLHVPAAPGSKITVFKNIFTDIGDEQSISASLSTFSGHIKNLVSMDKNIKLPTLILLDESGTGTEPIEGGALGAALIDHFLQKGALVVATTHNEILKTYAVTNDAVTCAGFGFDPETFTPNYLLNYGKPGRSLSLEIAERLGIPNSVIKAARKKRESRETQLADHLAKIEKDTQIVAAHEKKLAVEQERLQTLSAKLTDDRKMLDKKFKSAAVKLDDQIDRHVRLANSQIDAVVEELRERASEMESKATERVSLGNKALTTGDTGVLRAETRSRIQKSAFDAKLSSKATLSLNEEVISNKLAQHQPEINSRVSVLSLGLNGYVRELNAMEASVEVNGKRLQVHLSDLRVSTNEKDQGKKGKITIQSLSADKPTSELNVIGCNVDEALLRTEKYLDDSILGDLRQVRVVHGHGKGILRQSIANFLEKHPQVDGFEAARPEEGGTGVTIVQLKE